MKSYNPQDEYDRKEAQRLAAPPWMLEVLKMNPAFCSWGPGEDCMKGDEGDGWDSAMVVPTWPELDLGLDHLNEVVNFHFAVERATEPCSPCGGTGYNPKTRHIDETFYGNGQHDPRRWCEKLTDDEVDALWDLGRLIGFASKPTAAEVNAQQRRGGFSGLDAGNRFMVVEIRAKRLGVWGRCPKCHGQGSIFTEPAPRLALVLWVLHPRQGASRGCTVNRVTEGDLPSVFTYLRSAAERNAERFARIPTH